MPNVSRSILRYLAPFDRLRQGALLSLLGVYAGCASDSAKSENVASASEALFSTIPYRGVNLASAEFATDPNGGGVFPGTYNVDYVYPSVSEADYYIAKGMNTFRIPFRWERLQRTLNGAFDATEQQRLTDVVTGITAKGATVILDPHNYGRYLTQTIGSTSVPNAAFADFWTRLATLFKSNSRVIFAVMNEPHDMPSTEGWVVSANAAIAAIRATMATNLILVQGNGWSGAHSWNQTWYGTANAVAMRSITDPQNNFAFEVHQYLDSDFSGATGNCVSTTIGSEKLQNFTDWLSTNHYKGFLSEYGGGRNATCYAAIDDVLKHIKNNSSLYLGWTYWSGGPWWGEYELTLEPTNGQDRPQMAYITPYLTDGSGGSGGTGGTSSAGGSSAKGGSSSAGGSSAKGGSSSAGGSSAKGGSSSAGGSSAKGGSSSAGGSSAKGGSSSAGGSSAKGGSSSAGGSTGSSAEPCTPAKTVTGGQSGNFNTTFAYCFRTPDNINGWGCSNFDGRTLFVNDTAKTCGSLPMPTKYNGYYYFEVSAGAYSWASIYWW